MELKLNNNLKNVPVSGIRRFGALAAKKEGCVFLSIGEPDFDTPQNIKDAACSALDRGVTHYPPNVGTAALLDEISAFEQKKRQRLQPRRHYFHRRRDRGAVYGAVRHTQPKRRGDNPRSRFPDSMSRLSISAAQNVCFTTPLRTAFSSALKS